MGNTTSSSLGGWEIGGLIMTFLVKYGGCSVVRWGLCQEPGVARRLERARNPATGGPGLGHRSPNLRFAGQNRKMSIPWVQAWANAACQSSPSMETRNMNTSNQTQLSSELKHPLESQTNGHPSKLHAQGAAVYRLAEAMVRRAFALRGEDKLAPWEREERAADLVAEAYAVMAEEPLRWSEAEPLEVMREASKRCGLHRREARRQQLVDAIESDTQRHNGRALAIKERIVDETRPWRYAYCLAESEPELWALAKAILLDDPALSRERPQTLKARCKRLGNTLPMQLLAWVAEYPLD